MAKAIIQLCPHSPTAPLLDFQSLSPKQKEGIYQHIEEELKPGSVNRAVNWRHYTFAHEALDQTSNPIETEAMKSSERNTGYTTYLSKHW
jgi:hypothetical protein